MTSGKSSKPTLLHGVLYLTLTSAKNLPPTPIIHGVFKKKTTDPYVRLIAGDSALLSSSVLENTRNPRWDQDFRVNVCCAESELLLKVVDKDMKNGHSLGVVRVPCRELAKETMISGWKTLTSDSNVTLDSYIKFTLSYSAVEELSDSLAVSNSYYPVRKLSSLTLYQDAHSTTPANLRGPRNCFEDIYNSMLTAKKFIYISGRIDPNIKLIRSQKRCLTLGKLLKRRCKAGVNVLILLWDEESRLQTIPSFQEFIQSAVNTKEYFKGSGVRVVLADRTKAKPGFLKEQTAGTCYTHSQRFVVLDVPDLRTKKRGLGAFTGGLDMGAGFWDTPHHTLFSKEHRQDFFQPCLSTTPDIGPRLPQHGVHCKVEGRAALDILRNFEERWRKQAPLKKSFLSKVNSNKYSLKGGAAKQNKWSVQVFRSISEDSSVFLRDDNLQSVKGKLVDDGIHRALVHHIRRSQKFLYLETNQFMARSWKGAGPSDRHLVAMEIVSKVCQQIFDEKRYTVYIVLPLHPAGNPASSQIQEMLYWQSQTMDLMYKMIAKAISKKGPAGAKVTDYLNFYSLASKVTTAAGPYEDLSDANVPLAAKTKRGMINISGSVMVVDDEYILMSSGGVSQGSLSGRRNTELAIGAWQPNHTQENLEDKPHLQGKVHKFRLSLWTEHTGTSNPSFRRPHRIGCVREMNKIANENWKLLMSDNSATTSHLIKYPLAIQQSGQIVSRKDAKFLPDTKARTLGRQMRFPAEKLTT
ncbi:hypothetical protein ACHWQZ_G006213 [Mnemiopsis leidyi]